MSSSRVIKKRIRSTKNISQITKAMEAVSAVKMRKSQEVALRSRPYALAALEILSNLSGKVTQADFFSPLLEKREVRKICLLTVTSDKGLCGAFNGNVLRKAVDLVGNFKVPVEFIAVGKKGADFLKKRNFKLYKEITGAGDFGATEETKFLADLLGEVYESGRYDEIYAVYTNFLSVMKQEVVVDKILPFSAESIKKRIDEIIPRRGKYAGAPKVLGGSGTGFGEYLFEPSPEAVLNRLLPMFLEIQVYHVILEANASEHSARMVAMKNAGDNAEDLISALTLSYNKARQAQITKELTEITAGVSALQ
ncbi:MAG: ATP synthase gamma chain [Candidatus Jorgensenbacteria bacterium GW2011_GWA1_48_13]|uniref:ATP synthase gamma chain n=1 Tax=Candidatus Jorgensenbacteria bacterium GW2011_GWB1_50_10 TaxID=1618665 RepID=A0A0G1W896_9BACT|nr:MAG: ATP synthase gamma chain [Candidatus Jorgensenbacteria bacterium GW2011_GWA1_48_13]KKW15001.1 MAG: ATP synthase gamma chain [Candidatus Jorgensenbacteria bacterium GW2011_GWB1_50_10]